MENKRELSDAEAGEMSTLWRKLVRLYHPDRFANEPGKLETYVKLTSAINHARDTGDLTALREIATRYTQYNLAELLKDRPAGILGRSVARRYAWGASP